MTAFALEIFSMFWLLFGGLVVVGFVVCLMFWVEDELHRDRMESWKRSQSGSVSSAPSPSSSGSVSRSHARGRRTLNQVLSTSIVILTIAVVLSSRSRRAVR